MKSICYVVPYFGTLPKGFGLWLMSCKYNPTVNWIIYTDDKTEYDYPDNVKVKYTSFDAVKKSFAQHFDFPIYLDNGWKLCDFRPAYGELFADDLAGYDFWGYCDCDLMFGDIRKFYTDEILDTYDKVAFFGHSTLYRNNKKINSLYKTVIDTQPSYIDVMSKPKDRAFAFDELGMENIFNELGIPYFKEINFANLTKYETKFHLDLMPKEDEYKNKRQVFTWDNGRVLRHYLHNGKINTEEYVYIHFWCRPMSYRVSDFNKGRYLIYSDVVTDRDFELTPALIRKKGRSHPIAFYAKSLWKNRHKLTPERIIFNIKGSLNRNRNNYE